MSRSRFVPSAREHKEKIVAGFPGARERADCPQGSSMLAVSVFLAVPRRIRRRRAIARGASAHCFPTAALERRPTRTGPVGMNRALNALGQYYPCGQRTSDVRRLRAALTPALVPSIPPVLAVLPSGAKARPRQMYAKLCYAGRRTKAVLPEN